MTVRTIRARSGITLTEILISIMIMGVGMVSLATLFPLGLLRIRDAQRSSRSVFLTESAAADIESHNLLGKAQFLNTYLCPWYGGLDPFIIDTGAYGTPAGGVSRQGIPGPGLPVAYDPLWRFQVQDTSHPNFPGYYLGAASEARFGSGVGFVRSDPGGGAASAWGLQRLTNFNPQWMAPYNTQFGNTVYPAIFGQNTVPDIFVSPEDVILQSESSASLTSSRNSTSSGSPSLVVPDMGTTGLQFNNDWRFTWMFTGQQSDSSNGAVFQGDVVIFENRPFGVTQVNTPFAGTQYVVDGETVVEGVFGYGSDRVVLIRWPDTMPDPEVKTGNWIADVTYERLQTIDNTRFPIGTWPGQRCEWYQIVKRTTPGPHAFSSDPGGVTFRAMSVWVGTPLKARTLLNNSREPVHVNAVLLSPNVVNVFSNTFYAR